MRKEIAQDLEVLNDIAHIASDSGIRVPSELTMLSKTLLNLDDIDSALAPEFDPNASIHRHAGEIMQKRMMKSLSLGAVRHKKKT